MKPLLVIALVASAVIGCGPGAGTYCQSGSKYGTQCYSQSDVSNPPGQRPQPPADPNVDRK